MTYHFNIKIEYTVSVTVQLRQEGEETFLEGSYVTESYRKDTSNDIKEELGVIEVREDALISGLINCMYLSEHSGHRKTHESLTRYIKKLEEQFALPGMQIVKKKKNDI